MTKTRMGRPRLDAEALLTRQLQAVQELEALQKTPFLRRSIGQRRRELTLQNKIWQLTHRIEKGEFPAVKYNRNKAKKLRNSVDKKARSHQ